MKIKLGVIGYGGMGKWHAQNAPRAGVEIAAVCDIDEVKQIGRACVGKECSYQCRSRWSPYH